MKVTIDKIRDSYIVRNAEYSFSFWCTRYTIDDRSSETKFISLWNDNNYVGTIACSEIVERFYKEEK
jgi:hypothetical protein